ncbi:hypothetical protein BQ8420_11390 [Nocardiopsis sp. JB363]|nr:hypothetical protein BQ8420_11390 [Nocardiopsis sp. JB363]
MYGCGGWGRDDRNNRTLLVSRKGCRSVSNGDPGLMGGVRRKRCSSRLSGLFPCRFTRGGLFRIPSAECAGQTGCRGCSSRGAETIACRCLRVHPVTYEFFTPAGVTVVSSGGYPLRSSQRGRGPESSLALP